MSPSDRDRDAAELDAMAARAGMPIRDSLRPGVLAGYRDLRRMCALLHTPRPADNEPAFAYRVASENTDDRS
ncbi:hypothetical protein ACIRPH_19695 [Nocardiopsis sp. NPDC101807]|uniref:hypothetical protein n=1 Tax=Nocardiopsis sp. NPDC101807 TaxID=3364339 RepID=UPI0037F5F24F